jgi:uncharacterized membrane protein
MASNGLPYHYNSERESIIYLYFPSGVSVLIFALHKTLGYTTYDLTRADIQRWGSKLTWIVILSVLAQTQLQKSCY